MQLQLAKGLGMLQKEVAEMGAALEANWGFWLSMAEASAFADLVMLNQQCQQVNNMPCMSKCKPIRVTGRPQTKTARHVDLVVALALMRPCMDAESPSITDWTP